MALWEEVTNARGKETTPMAKAKEELDLSGIVACSTVLRESSRQWVEALLRGPVLWPHRG